MRLIFSSSYYKNTDISDEEGNKLYTISTPQGWKQVTTITKHHKGRRSNRAPEELCVIEWHKIKKTKFRFGERVMEADTILYRRPYSWYAGSSRTLSTITDALILMWYAGADISQVRMAGRTSGK